MINKGLYDDGFFDFQANASLRGAQKISIIINDLFHPKSVVDFGCGVGWFLRIFRNMGVSDVLGVDGDYVPRDRLAISASEFKPIDLSNPVDLGRVYDIVMSFEVAEHLAPEMADTFIETLCRHGDVIIFSAALPHQGGVNHVNEQWPSYWIEKFLKFGFHPFDIIRPNIWDDAGIDFWYRNNTIVLANKQGMERHRNVLAKPELPGRFDIVHPHMYGLVVRRAQQADALEKFIAQLADFNKPVVIVRGADGSIHAEPVVT